MPAQQQPLRVTISPLTVIKLLAMVLILLFVAAIRDILLLIFVSMVLAAAFDPWVDWLQKKGLPRTAGILLIYVLFVSAFAAAVVMMIPLIVQQTAQLYAAFPHLLEQFNNAMQSFQGVTLQESLQEGVSSFTGQLQTGEAAARVVTTLGSIFGGLLGMFAMMVMTFYMLVEENNIEKLVKLVSPEKYHDFAIHAITDISQKLGRWIRGQLMLGVIVGLMVYVGLKIIGVEYALVLAVLSAVTELIPFVGPWIGAVPGVLIAFIQAPILGLAAAVVYLVVQQLENNLITPKLMSKVVGLSPLVVIIAILVGAKVAGVIGALLAVPTALIIQTVIKHLDRLPES